MNSAERYQWLKKLWTERQYVLDNTANERIERNMQNDQVRISMAMSIIELHHSLHDLINIQEDKAQHG